MIKVKDFVNRVATLTLILILLWIGLVAYLFTDSIRNPQETALREVAEITVWQSRAVVKMLKDIGVNFESASISKDSIVDDLNSNWNAYDLTDSNGMRYVLILRLTGGSFSALFDSDGNLLSGIVDNRMIPDLL